MDIATLTSFFGWCTLINIAVLLFWVVFLMGAPDLVYRIQSRFFPIPRATYDVIIYSLLGAFKLTVIVFSIVPYLALLAIA